MGQEGTKEVVVDAAVALSGSDFIAPGNPAVWLVVGLALTCLLWGRRIKRAWGS